MAHKLRRFMGVVVVGIVLVGLAVTYHYYSRRPRPHGRLPSTFSFTVSSNLDEKGGLTVKQGDSVTLLVTFRSKIPQTLRVTVSIFPHEPHIATDIPPVQEFPVNRDLPPLPQITPGNSTEGIRYELADEYLTLQPSEPVTTQITLFVADDAPLGKYDFWIGGETIKSMGRGSHMAWCYVLVVVAKPNYS